MCVRVCVYVYVYVCVWLLLRSPLVPLRPRRPGGVLAARACSAPLAAPRRTREGGPCGERSRAPRKPPATRQAFRTTLRVPRCAYHAARTSLREPRYAYHAARTSIRVPRCAAAGRGRGSAEDVADVAARPGSGSARDFARWLVRGPGCGVAATRRREEQERVGARDQVRLRGKERWTRWRHRKSRKRRT